MKYINIIEANLVISQYSVHNKMSNLEILILLSDQTELQSNTGSCFQNNTGILCTTRYAVVVYYLSLYPFMLLLSICFTQTFQSLVGNFDTSMLLRKKFIPDNAKV